MADELAVLLGGAVAGRVQRLRGGVHRLDYDDAWRASDAAYALSVSMPLIEPAHDTDRILPWLEGLLPDNDFILEAWGREYGVSPRNTFGLLARVGADVAGAAQFIVPDGLERLSRAGSVRWLKAAEVEERLAQLRNERFPWRRVEDPGYFSLAGAQPKTALLWDRKRWGIPSGRTPTTHILKPPVLDFEFLAENEHLCLRLAGALELPAANTEVVRFGKQTALVVERYDRFTRDGEIGRVHQEDFCQALGVSPRLKYEADGGPSAADLVRVLRDHSSDHVRDIDLLVSSLALHWALGAPDAHAKNYSILIAPRAQVRLAPLYDIISILPYPTRFFAPRTRLAMSIGGERRLGYIRRRHWERFAEGSGLNPARTVGLVTEVIERVPDVVTAVAREAISEKLSRTFATRFRDSVIEHADRCAHAMKG